MATRNSPRILFIGLDAGDANLIEQWAHEGHLPVLQQLMEEGAWGRLKTTTELGHASVWPSLLTGTTPADHGIYGFVQVVPGTYEISQVWAKQRTQPNFWEYLDKTGKRCIIFDAPFDYPIKGFKGIQILEWGGWVRFWKQEGFPRRIWKQLLDHFPPPVEPAAIVYRQNRHQLRRLCGWLTKGAALKAQAVKWLMREQHWELFVVIFREPHPAGHYFWNLDTSHPSFTPTNSGHTFLRDVYAAVDRAIGEILTGLDEQVTLFIVSGDGMGPNYSAWHLLPDVLRKLGFLTVNGGSFEEGSGGAVWNPDSFLNAIRRKIPSQVRLKISRLLPAPVRFRLRRRWLTIPIDWSRARAYYVPNECEGLIRINLKGREPSGCVAKETEYDKVCQELSEQLTELVNPQTGQTAVRQIVRTDKICGSKNHSLPDLIVLWDEKAKVTTQVHSERCGLIAKPFSACDLSPYYVGNHKSPGFIIVKGPETRSGRFLEGRHILDLTPTLLSFFGIPQPSLMSGQVWNDLQNGT